MSFSRFHMAFAALMHDIGKFKQRTGAKDLEQNKFRAMCRLDDTQKYLTYKHVMWTAEFLYKYQLPIEDWDSIAEVAGCHHNSSVFDHHNYKKYLDFLIQADHVASSWDREKAEDYIGKYRADKVPLYSLFDGISLEQDLPRTARTNSYPIKAMTPDSMYPEPENKASLKEDYIALWDEFERDYAAIHQYYLEICKTNPQGFVDGYFQQYINSIQALLFKYTWCIPANTTEAKPSSSLYYHCYNASTIASCLHCAEIYQGTSMDQGTAKARPFMIIACDVNGIQSYLYDLNPENSRKAAKLLRSRSAQIKIILDLVARQVIDGLELTSQNMILNVSGKWFILAPNHPDLISRLHDIKLRLDQEIYTKFLGAFSINLDWSTQIGLSDLNKHLFLSTMKRCIQSLEARKYEKYSSALIENGKWKSDAFVINREAMYSNTRCDYCHRRPISGDSNAADNCCPQCEAEIELGRILVSHKPGVYKIFKNNSARGLVRLGDYVFQRVDREELNDPYPDTDYFVINDLPFGEFPLPRRAIANSVPLNKHGVVADFQQIAETESGEKAIAIFKGDVDNLGQMFVRGLKQENGECSITEYTGFSASMDYFFSVIIPHLIDSRYASDIYVVYSGGDDFCMVGKWDKVIELCSEIQKLFCRFTGSNKEIHFSAAICLLHSKAPIRFVVKETEEHLKGSKNIEGKGNLYLFETYVPLALLDKQLELAFKLHELLESDKQDDKGITKQFYYRLLGYHEMYAKSVLNQEITHDNLYDALLHYDVKRNIAITDKQMNIKNPDVVKLFLEFTNFSQDTSMKYLRIPVCHTLYKNRTSKED